MRLLLLFFFFSDEAWHDMLSLAILLFWVWLPYNFRFHQVVCH